MKHIFSRNLNVFHQILSPSIILLQKFITMEKIEVKEKLIKTFRTENLENNWLNQIHDYKCQRLLQLIVWNKIRMQIPEEM